jgi:hypothetical protein
MMDCSLLSCYNYGREGTIPVILDVIAWKDNIIQMIPELTEEVIAKLTDSQKINIQILQNLTSLNTRINTLSEDVAAHQKILITGNGTPSLQERVRNVEEYTQSVKYWQRFVGGAIILQSMAFMFGIIVAIVRFLPLLETLSKKP